LEWARHGFQARLDLAPTTINRALEARWSCSSPGRPQRRLTPVPSGRITHRSVLPSAFPRSEAKRIAVQSGDQVGSVSRAGPFRQDVQLGPRPSYQPRASGSLLVNCSKNPRR
jgi:hypothetical protein